ncbi:VTT domain-containing protein [Candidatus Bathyarchaeota archaeon]|nr:VTT domain-containing protein [Candidatus Bathyarchaeota archaeon]
MEAIATELSEHYLRLPAFFVTLTILFPALSGLSFFSAWLVLKISNMVLVIRRNQLLSRLSHVLASLLIVISFVPMVWILRELIMVEGSAIQAWFISTMPLLYSYLQIGQVFLTSLVVASKNWMTMYGPIGLFSAMILSSVVSPIPNEVVLAFAGMTMSPLDVAIYGALGSTVGAILCYYVARLGGRPLAEKFVKKKTLDSADGWFLKRGKWAVLLGRFIPFVPFDAVSYFSGLVKMKILAFTVLTFVGSVPRCLFYAYMGEFIAEYNIPVLIIISVIIVIFFLIFKIRSRAKNQERAILSQATSKCN